MSYLVYRCHSTSSALSESEYTPIAGTARLNLKTGTRAEDVVRYGWTTDSSATKYCPIRAVVKEGMTAFIGRASTEQSSYTVSTFTATTSNSSYGVTDTITTGYSYHTNTGTYTNTNTLTSTKTTGYQPNTKVTTYTRDYTTTRASTYDTSYHTTSEAYVSGITTENYGFQSSSSQFTVLSKLIVTSYGAPDSTWTSRSGSTSKIYSKSTNAAFTGFYSGTTTLYQRINKSKTEITGVVQQTSSSTGSWRSTKTANLTASRQRTVTTSPLTRSSGYNTNSTYTGASTTGSTPLISTGTYTQTATYTDASTTGTSPLTTTVSTSYDTTTNSSVSTTCSSSFIKTTHNFNI